MKWIECKELIAQDYANMGGQEASWIFFVPYYGMILLC